MSTSAGNAETEMVGTVRLSHPDKELFPELHLTKSKLAKYYEMVAGRMLAHCADRPLSILSCPQGRRACFFQKHLLAADALGIPKLQIREKDGQKKWYSYVSAPRHLIALVQLNSLEIHPWNAGIKNVERPDRLIFDLDPDAELDEKKVIAAAFLVRDVLDEANLVSFVRCTGGKGLHVVAPLKPVHSWADVKEFAHAIARVFEAQDPKQFISRARKAERTGKIFIDYLRNQRGATSIANYSTRAREGAPVAVPLSWRDLEGESSIPRFSVTDVIKLMKTQRSDVWAKMLKISQTLPKGFHE